MQPSLWPRDFPHFTSTNCLPLHPGFSIMKLLSELDGTCYFLVTTWALAGTHAVVPNHSYSHYLSSEPGTAADTPFSGTTSELCCPCSTGLQPEGGMESLFLVLWPHSSLPPEPAGRFQLLQLSGNVQEKKSSTSINFMDCLHLKWKRAHWHI